MNKDNYFAIGVMSGTSFDGIDISLICSDGKKYFNPIKSSFYKYDSKIRIKLFEISKNFNKNLHKLAKLTEVRSEVTKLYVKALKSFISKNKLSNFELIGIHGQTIYHDPKKKISIQLCDGEYISNKLKKKVVFDFRQNDLKYGGEGAPLTPIFHKMLCDYLNLRGNTIFLNIGGVSNLTYVSSRGSIESYDTGPGMALLDEYVFLNKKMNYDKNGIFSLKGKVNYKVLNKVLKNRYFKKKCPKSIDRFYFSLEPFMHLQFYDACATISTFTAQSISNEVIKFKTNNIILMGGGSKNKFLINYFRDNLESKINIIDEFHLNKDFIESQAFAYLGIRRLRNLPISFPSTTGSSRAVIGGKIVDYR